MDRSTHTLAVKSQNWIIKATLKLMQQKPYNEITVSEICKLAQLDRRTFYRNFKDKDDVIEYYISCLQEEYLTTLQSVEIRTIKSMAKAQFEFWKKHLDFLNILQSNGFLVGILLKVTNDFIPQIYKKFHFTMPPNFDYKVTFISGGFCNILFNWISHGAKETPDEIATIVCELFDEDNSYWNHYIQK